MNEAMKTAWAEITMFYEDPTAEDFDAFLRTWQLAINAEREACEQLFKGKVGQADLRDIAEAIRTRGHQ